MLSSDERQRIEEEERKRLAEEEYRAEVRMKLQSESRVASRSPLSVTPEGTATETAHVAEAEQAEKVLLDEKGIKVTSARFLVEEEKLTYAMSGITSVKTEVEDPSKLGPVVTIFLGAAFAILNSGQSAMGVLLGILVVAVGVLWFRSRRTQYNVVLTTAAGERQPYESSDRVFVEKIVKAINDAIVHRG